MSKKLVDPAELFAEKKADVELDDQIKAVDISSLSLKDFKQLAEKTAKLPHPFDGYPIKKDIALGKKWVSQTYIVGINPMHEVPQDRSNENVSVGEKIVNLKTYHSRVFRCYEQGGINVDIVFDRELHLSDGVVMCAIVTEPSLRAQLMFVTDIEGRVSTDKRYVFLDGDQGRRLRRVYENITAPQRKNDRLAAAITGESNESLDNIPEEV